MIVIISGLPGSGKSELADNLSNKLGFPLVSSERLKKRLQALGKLRLKDKIFVYQKLARLTQQNLKSNKGVVVDASFTYQVSRDLFTKLADNLSMQIKWILVSASDEKIKQRLFESSSDYELAFKEYERMRDEFEPMVGKTFNLDSTTTDTNKMMKAAERFINRNAAK